MNMSTDVKVICAMLAVQDIQTQETHDLNKQLVQMNAPAFLNSLPRVLLSLTSVLTLKEYTIFNLIST